ncbi:unnamed protein product [Blepharisma stoltei]|uniref:Chromosome partition protein Smc n=1 Tax=Blepharisma stoltei TaxID=1481888 RepID=A0AAU9JI54_9CILI|nr:unnamed protein product [Blepharisma stoltei]
MGACYSENPNKFYEDISSSAENLKLQKAIREKKIERIKLSELNKLLNSYIDEEQKRFSEFISFLTNVVGAPSSLIEEIQDSNTVSTWIKNTQNDLLSNCSEKTQEYFSTIDYLARVKESVDSLENHMNLFLEQEIKNLRARYNDREIKRETKSLKQRIRQKIEENSPNDLLLKIQFLVNKFEISKDVNTIKGAIQERIENHYKRENVELIENIKCLDFMKLDLEGKNNELEKEMAKLKNNIAAQQIELTSLKENLSAKDKLKLSLESKNNELEKEIEELKASITNQKKEISSLNEGLSLKNDFEWKNKELEKEVDKLKNSIANQQIQISELNENLLLKDNIKLELEEKNRKLESDTKELKGALANQQIQISSLNEDLIIKDTEASVYKNQATVLDEELNNLKTSLTLMKIENKDLNKEIAGLKQTLNQASAEIREFQERNNLI